MEPQGSSEPELKSAQKENESIIPLRLDVDESTVPFLTNRKPSAISLTVNVSSVSIKESGSEGVKNPDTNPKTNNSKAIKTGWRRYLGVAYTILAVNMLALTNTIMKKYAHIHPFNVGVWYSSPAILVQILALLYATLWSKIPIGDLFRPLIKDKKNLLLTLGRGVLMGVIFNLSVFAFRYITAADLRTVISSVVIAVFIFGWMFLGEKCGVVPVIIAIVALAGIVIMTRPPMITGAEEFDIGTLKGIGLAFCTMILIAMHLVIIRYLSNVHHAVGNFVLLVWGLIQSIILAWACGLLEMPKQDEIIGLSLSGLCLGFSLTFLVLALQEEEAGVVALVRTSEVIFVFFWQWVIVGTKPDLISMVGATLVISGVVTVTLRKWVDTLPKKNPTRRRLRFLLL